jgi:MFS family permease
VDTPVSVFRADRITEFGENLRRAGPELWALGVLPALAGVAALLATPWLWFLFAALALACGFAASAEYPLARAQGTSPAEEDPPRGERLAAGALIGFAAPLATAVLAAGLLSAAGWVLASGLPSGLSWVAAQPVTHLVTDPITAWFSAHAAGLPVSALMLGLLAAAGAALLYLAALFGSTTGRVGLTLAGAAATWIVWTATPVAAHRPVAAGLTVLACLVLALPAFTVRRRSPAVLVCHHTDSSPQP